MNTCATSPPRWVGDAQPFGRDIVLTLIIINVAVLFGQFAFTRQISLNEFRGELLQEVTKDEAEELYEEILRRGGIRVSVLEEWGVMDPRKVLRGQVWRTLTAAFLHSRGVQWHIIGNMWVLYLAGFRLSQTIGQREFLWFYLTSAVVSYLMFMFWGVLTGSMTSGLGASGAVAAVLMVYALTWPRQQWLLMFVIPVPVIALVVVYAALDVFPMLQQLSGRDPGDKIAHSAHVGGMLFGFLYHRNRWRVTDWMAALPELRLGKLFRRRPKLKIHAPPPARELEPEPESIPADVSARVDKLLAKISSDGEASLTDADRQFLADASRRYRARGRPNN